MVEFDVYACIGFTGPGEPGGNGGTLLLVMVGLLALPGLTRHLARCGLN